VQFYSPSELQGNFRASKEESHFNRSFIDLAKNLDYKRAYPNDNIDVLMHFDSYLHPNLIEAIIAKYVNETLQESAEIDKEYYSMSI